MKTKNYILTFTIVLIAFICLFGSNVSAYTYSDESYISTISNYEKQINQLYQKTPSKSLLSDIKLIRTTILNSTITDSDKIQLNSKLDSLSVSTFYTLISDIYKIENFGTKLNNLVDLEVFLNESSLTDTNQIYLKESIKDNIKNILSNSMSEVVKAYDVKNPTINSLIILNYLKDNINNYNLEYNASSVITELDSLILAIGKTLKITPTFTVDALKSEVKFKTINNLLYINMPKINGNYKYVYSLTDTTNNKLLKLGEINNGEDILMDEIYSENIKFTILISIINVNVSASNEEYGFYVNLEINDEKDPEINYLYVENGRLYINYSDEYPFSKGAITYTIDDKTSELDLINSYIDIKVPSRVTIKLVDNFGNRTIKTFNVKSDNSIIFGTVSNKIKNRLDERQTTKVKPLNNYTNIITVEKDNKIHFFNTFAEILKETYQTFNYEDLNFVSNEFSLDDNGYVLFDKEGIFNIKINHTFYTQDVIDIYVYVDAGSVKNTNIKDMKSNSPLLVSKKDANIENYMKFELFKTTYKANTAFLFYRNLNDNIGSKITDKVELELNELNEFEVIDLITKKTYKFSLKYVKSANAKTVSFTDVKSNNKYYAAVKTVALKNIMTGYSNKTFRPNNKVTVKVFIETLGKYISKENLNDLKPIENYKKYSNDYYSIVFNRLTATDLKDFDTYDMSRYITKEEAAFLLSKTIDLNNYNYKSKSFSDAKKSIYASDIKNVLSTKIMIGKNNTEFKPKAIVTRGDLATIIHSLYKYKP